MKKALTILVIFAIVLSLSASAFADNGGIKITKNPSDEYHFIGETAAFVANARQYSGITWTVVDPDGYRYSVDEFRSFFPHSYISGDTTGTMIINNGADSTTEAVLHIIYQGKTLDIPQGLLMDLVPGYRPDPTTGQPTYPAMYW